MEEVQTETDLFKLFLRGGFNVPRADGFDLSFDDFWSGGEEETEGFAVRAVVSRRPGFLFEHNWFVFSFAISKAELFKFGNFACTLLPSSKQFAIGIY